jgi:uncharacterized membrane protein HdeD (DUF308 family)
MMGTSSVAEHATGWSMAIGVLLILLGVLAMVAPFFAGLAATVFYGWLIAFAGAGHFIYAWSERGAGAALWQMLIGVLYLFAGFYVIFHPIGGIVALTLVLGFYIAVEGVLEIVTFFAVRRMPGTAWFLVDAIASLVLAALILLHWPNSSVWAIGTLLGISILFSGVARLTMPMSRRKLVPAV